MSPTKSKSDRSAPALPSAGVRLAVLIAVTAVFALILHPDLLVSRIAYTAGDIAEKDIKAPRDFLVEDQAATDIKRLQALQEVLTVYDFDAELAPRLAQVVDQAFADMRALRQAAAESRGAAAEGDYSPAADPRRAPAAHSAEDLRKLFEDKLGVRLGKGPFTALEAEGFSKRLADAVAEILAKLLEAGVVTSKEATLKDLEKGIVLRQVRTKEERIVQDPRQFYSLDQARSMVRTAGQPWLRELDYAAGNLVVDLAQRLIQPNVTLNRNETEERKNRARAEVKPVLYKIKAGEMLLREGERVTDLHLLKLAALESEAKPRQFLFTLLGAAAVMLAVIAVFYTLFLERTLSDSRTPARDLLLMAGLFLFFLLMAQSLGGFLEVAARGSQYAVPAWPLALALPLAAAPMIVCVFLGVAAAVPFAIVTAFGAALVNGQSLPICIYYLVVGSMGSYWLRNCRERKVFVVAGAKTGLLSIGLAAGIALLAGETSGGGFAWGLAFAFLGGFGAGVLAAGIVPLVEYCFDYTTDITLLELANLDRPILRRLMIEAPGTYHHSVIVGSMAEAAAAEIDANPLLAKVTGYYHDIGKVRKPLYFIENQRNGKNRHDRLAPSMSSLILIAHIKDGVEIAREHKLSSVIVEGIRQHHGTSLIRYFYEKARQAKGESQVKEEDFRYPGPKPRTREAALVMLADIVEAASRTLENPTPGRIKGHVQELINRALQDGQLDECDITLKDIHKISVSFNTILNGIHHNRIEYIEQRAPDGAQPRSGARNDHSHRQSSTAPPDPPADAPHGGPDPVKRLRAS
ncbi:MAG: HDIG domain-containing protein [Desulfobacterales bacterium]|nr:HDIG domain-containing protein [Desulfobacterales bacterium]